MSKKRLKFSEQIAKALVECGESRYAVAKATGLTQSTLSRLIGGKGWIGRVSTDALADYLGLSVTVNPKAATPRHKGR